MRRAENRFPDRILRRLTVLAAFGMILLYLCPLVDPETYWIFSLPGLFYPLVLAVQLAAILYWAMRRKWLFLLPFFTVIAGLDYMLGLFHWHKEPRGRADTFRIATFNAHELRDVQFPHAFVSPTAWTAMIQKIDADILCLQEIEGLGLGPGSIRMPAGWYEAVRSPEAGLAIYSRVRPIRGGSKAFSSNNGFQYADFRHAGGSVLRVYNAHLYSNRITSMAYKVAEGGRIPEREDMHLFPRMLARYKESARERSGRTKIWAAHIDKSPYPYLLCGDFNDIPLSWVYRRLRRNTGDAFLDAGRGRGWTYVGPLKGLRIDYILTGGAFQTRFCQRLNPGNLSDHCPLIADIQWK